MHTLPVFLESVPKPAPPVTDERLFEDDVPDYVTEAEYWQKYYQFPDKTYEWNNGVLEEKGVSGFSTVAMADWFSLALSHYLSVRRIAKKVFLEMAFPLRLPHKKEIRRPDLGIVLNTNPVPLLADDASYKGTFDLCIEALSYSTKADIKRDTVDKKLSYAQAGVSEYFILDSRDRYMEFYRRSAQGIYMPIPPTAEGVVQSSVLPGFQFRKDDLFTQPVPEAMADDPVYQAFVMPAYQREKQARYQAEQRAAQLEAKLRALGFDPENL